MNNLPNNNMPDSPYMNTIPTSVKVRAYVVLLVAFLLTVTPFAGLAYFGYQFYQNPTSLCYGVWTLVACAGCLFVRLNTHDATSRHIVNNTHLVMTDPRSGQDIAMPISPEDADQLMRMRKMRPNTPDGRPDTDSPNRVRIGFGNGKNND